MPQFFKDLKGKSLIFYIFCILYRLSYHFLFWLELDARILTFGQDSLMQPCQTEYVLGLEKRGGGNWNEALFSCP